MNIPGDAVRAPQAPDYPLKGVELKRYVSNHAELCGLLGDMLGKLALVCTSPVRAERCDNPATAIFWQDEREWYPCCDAHWPGGPQWMGSSRMRGGDHVALLLFEERLALDDRKPGDQVEKYDRSNAA